MENIEHMPPDDIGQPTGFVRPISTKRIGGPSHGTAAADPMFSSEPLIAYRYDSNLARQEEVIFTVKTMLQLKKTSTRQSL